MLSTAELSQLRERTDLIAAGEAAHVPDTSVQVEPLLRDAPRPTDPTAVVGSIRKLFNVAVYDDLLWAHVTHPKIAAVIADLLDTEHIKLYGDQLFMKGANTGSQQGWHQVSPTTPPTSPPTSL